MIQVGVTDFNEPALDHSWTRWALEKRNPTILITKNFTKLLEDFPTLLNQDNLIIHATITGYGSSVIEPGVVHPQVILDTLGSLTESQRKRIVVRIDPIIPLQDFVKQSLSIFNITKRMGFERHRISILDLYPKVVNRLEKDGQFLILKELKDIYNWDLAHTAMGEHKDYMVHAPHSIRKAIIDQFPGAEICAEPGFPCKEGCISRKDLELFGIKPEKRYVKSEQREFCSCLGIKKQLLRGGSCKQDCVYCYMQ